MSLSQKELKKWLSYDPETGVFKWLKRPRQRACSEVAGTINPDVYRQIGLGQDVYKAHQANSKRRSTNTTGYKGVMVFGDNRQKKFCARITVNYQSIWLGNFYTAEEAHAAYVAGARRYFGEFARAA